jgi:UDP-N-acetylmuramyl pentapeptide phosphotransferase/UDP-N-acetylglucosamine-1-phosphate transferase
MLLGLDIIISTMTDNVLSNHSTTVLFELKDTLATSIGILDNLQSVEKLNKGILQLQKTLVPTFTLILETISPYIFKVIKSIQIHSI